MSVRRSGRPHDDGDDAVVAELVEQPDLQGESPGRPISAVAFLFGDAARGQVELVRLVDQLHDARQADRVEPAPARLHVQAAQIALDVGRRGAQRSRVAAFAWYCRVRCQVLFGQTQALEIARLGDAVRA